MVVVLDSVLDAVEPDGADCWVYSCPVPFREQRKVEVGGVVDTPARLVWELLVGVLPPHMALGSQCRRWRCVNPDHRLPTSKWDMKRAIEAHA